MSSLLLAFGPPHEIRSRLKSDLPSCIRKRITASGKRPKAASNDASVTFAQHKRENAAESGIIVNDRVYEETCDFIWLLQQLRLRCLESATFSLLCTHGVKRSKNKLELKLQPSQAPGQGSQSLRVIFWMRVLHGQDSGFEDFH